MRRYFVNIKHGGGRIENAGAFQLPELSYAQVEALKGLAANLVQRVPSEAEPFNEVMLIVDETGHELASVPLSQALRSQLRWSGD